ncbi:MAG: ABC transporter ATP-binding protein [Archangium sp.]|nr:ABC transporter ATP-binding protein [Archangium sp.]
MTTNTQSDQQRPAATLRAVSKAYPNSSALRAVDLTLGPGEHVAVIGRSGSGKSTLLNMLTGIDRPTSGSVEVDGVDLGTLDEGALAVFRGRHIGIVFQFFQLIPTLSVRENVLLAMELVGAVPPSARDARAQRLLEEVGIAAHADRLPGSLSGGEQQRAAIARALANDPGLLVADEPTGNLDTETAASVAALLRDLARRGKTVVVVTHDPAVAATCSRVVQLTDGRLAERAS